MRRKAWADMAYSVRYRGYAHEVELRGRFTAPDRAVVRELFDIFNQPGGKPCVLDMEGLESLDFYGLEMLVLMNDMAQAKGVALTIRRPQGEVRDLLGLTGLDRLIPIET